MNKERLTWTTEKIKNKVVPALAVAVLGLSLLTSCGGRIDAKQTPTPSNYLSTPIVLPITTQETPFLSTDWHVCGTVQEGEGVITTLRKAANEQGSGGEPHELSITLPQQVEIMHQDGRVEVYTWEELLKKNPIVYPGDQVCDTVKPRLSATATPRPEDIHR